MTTTVITQLIVDSQGAVAGVAAFEAAMQKAKGSFENLETKTKTFDQSQKQLGQVLASNNPVFAAQLKMQAEMERQNTALTQSVKLGQISQTAANAELAKTVSRHEANIQAIKEHTGQLTSGERAMVAFRNATSGVQGQLIALSAGAGPVGVFLSALGPWGIAAGVGLGLIEKGLNAISDGAHALAEKTRELRQFSEITGLTTQQVQALRSEAGKFGLTGDEAQTAIQQFTARFNELRLGSGELLTQIRRINPALADQMQAMTNAGDALTLFGQALQNVDNIFQRNALVKAATGRGGLTSAAFLSGLNVDRLTQSYIDAGKGLDEGLIKRLPLLEIEIKKTNEQASKVLQSMFAEPTLAFEKYMANLRLGFAQTLADWQKQTRSFGQSAWEWISNRMGRTPQTAGTSPVVGPRGIPGIGDEFGGAGLNSGQKTLEAQAAEASKLVQVLGSLATITQILKARQLELNLAQRDMPDTSKITDAQKDALIRLAHEQANGVMAVKAQIDSTKVQVATLGMSVGRTAEYTAVQTKLNEAIRAGAPLNAADEAALRKKAAVLGEVAQAAERMKIASEIRFDRATMFLSDTDVQIAQRLKGLYGDDVPAALASTEASAMRVNAALKKIDDIGGTFASSFFTDLSHGVTAVDALKSALTRLSDTLIDMISRQLVRQALGGLAGSLFPIGGTGVAATASEQSLGAQAVAVLSGTGHTGAVIGEWPSQGRYVHPSYFDDAPRMHSGGGINWAAGERPFVGKVGEEVGWPNQLAQKYGGGGNNAPSVTISMAIDARGADAGSEARMRGAIEMAKAQLRSEVPAIVAKAWSQAPGHQK